MLGQEQEKRTPHRDRTEKKEMGQRCGLTQQEKEPTISQHHILVPGTLGQIQMSTLLPGESLSRILEGHQCLES